MNGNLEPEETVLDPNVELMYRAPGREQHQNITEVLDEIMNRLDRIEYLMEESVEQLNDIDIVLEELVNG